ncbi:hypothetical protein P7K49_002537 [Saguinus oedipus]|uniref:Uncharacterized protein n=1 Tax=Saguinus oedipus TaxID=9490 RepID=A0ABQ9WHM0_SAGOE|nr:hypothetical protein P7K49_002537 [Saguinus oedipus]
MDITFHPAISHLFSLGSADGKNEIPLAEGTKTLGACVIQLVTYLVVTSAPGVIPFLGHLGPSGSVASVPRLPDPRFGLHVTLCSQKQVFETPLPFGSSCFPASAGRPGSSSAPGGAPRPRKGVPTAGASSASSRNAGAGGSSAHPDFRDRAPDWLRYVTLLGGPRRLPGVEAPRVRRRRALSGGGGGCRFSCVRHFVAVAIRNELGKTIPEARRSFEFGASCNGGGR